MADQKLILSEIRALHKDVKSGVASNRNDPPGKQMMDSLSRSLPEEAEHHQLDLLRDEMQARLVALHSSTDNDAMVVAEPRQFQLPPARKAKLQADFTHSFNFREREFRESAISSPYDNTFLWMFNLDTEDSARKNTGFRQWLASPSDCLYWVTGKPGAGKSTLMKYISDFRCNGEGAKLCRRFLAEGAGSSKIATASFYFWASGAKIQATQTALFRTLLFDLLRDPLRDPTRPDLISRIAPVMWESACLLGTPFPRYWAEAELRDLLFRTIEQLSQDNTKVCLFIDGLDEFGGDPQTIISFVDKILKLPNVKLCVSSRPWVPFECAFRGASTLRVQDLTYPDIRYFTKSHFDKCEDFSRLMKREADYAAKLIDQVVEKSSGVFLWVRIVVASLITGLSNHDKVLDLQKRLDALPPELDDLYDKILDNIDPFYAARASQYFQLLLANDGSAEALLLSFADEDKGFCLTLPLAILSRNEHSARLETLGRRLSGSCKGLLEIGTNGRVSFLHRTVRDFLVKPENQEKAGKARRDPDFDAHLQLCAGFYCLMKAAAFSTWANSSPGDPDATDHLTGAFQTPDSITKRNKKRGEEAVVKWFTECLKRASSVTVGKHDMINALDSLNHDLKALPRLRKQLFAYVPLASKGITLSPYSPIKRHGYFFGDLSVTSQPRELDFTSGYDDLLPYAIRFGITDYVQAKAQSVTSNHENQLYNSVRARVRQLLHKRPIPPHRDHRGSFRTLLYLHACLADPPDPEMFKAFLGCHGASSKQHSVFSLANCLPLFCAITSAHSLVLDGLSVLEVTVGIALISSIAQQIPSAASREWRHWVPVLQLVAASYDQRLDIHLAKAFTKNFGLRYRGAGPRGPRPPGVRLRDKDPRPQGSTALAPEDLVKIFEIDCTDSNCINNWITILEKVRHLAPQ